MTRIRTLGQMVPLVKFALKTVNLGDEIIHEEDDHLSIADGTVSIARTTVEVPALPSEPGQLRTIFAEGWEVSFWVQYPGNREDPPDYQDSQLYIGINPYDAVKAAVMALHKDRLDNALLYYGEQSDDL
jgi:hypothetical protein